jgi:hypothetical protein
MGLTLTKEPSIEHIGETELHPEAKKAPKQTVRCIPVAA